MIQPMRLRRMQSSAGAVGGGQEQSFSQHGRERRHVPGATAHVDRP
jgi:hypothetical protein